MEPNGPASNDDWIVFWLVLLGTVDLVPDTKTVRSKALNVSLKAGVVD